MWPSCVISFTLLIRPGVPVSTYTTPRMSSGLISRIGIMLNRTRAIWERANLRVENLLFMLDWAVAGSLIPLYSRGFAVLESFSKRASASILCLQRRPVLSNALHRAKPSKGDDTADGRWPRHLHGNISAARCLSNGCRSHRFQALRAGYLLVSTNERLALHISLELG